MKYLIITKYGNYQIEAEDFEDAFNQVYSHHTGYDDLIAIIRIETDYYPQSRDCHFEYDLTEEDLHNLCLCDFFKHK